MAFGCNLMVYSPGIFPRPVNSFGNSRFMSTADSELTAASLAKRLSAIIAGRPSKAFY